MKGIFNILPCSIPRPVSVANVRLIDTVGVNDELSFLKSWIHDLL